MSVYCCWVHVVFYRSCQWRVCVRVCVRARVWVKHPFFANITVWVWFTDTRRSSIDAGLKLRSFISTQTHTYTRIYVCSVTLSAIAGWLTLTSQHRGADWSVNGLTRSQLCVCLCVWRFIFITTKWRVLYFLYIRHVTVSFFIPPYPFFLYVSFVVRFSKHPLPFSEKLHDQQTSKQMRANLLTILEHGSDFFIVKSQRHSLGHS